MSSAFELFPKHEHAERWKTAQANNPFTCPGKDTLDTACTCPDVMYSTRVRIKDATSTSRLYCGCCELLISFGQSTA